MAAFFFSINSLDNIVLKRRQLTNAFVIKQNCQPGKYLGHLDYYIVDFIIKHCIVIDLRNIIFKVDNMILQGRQLTNSNSTVDKFKS